MPDLILITGTTDSRLVSHHATVTTDTADEIIKRIRELGEASDALPLEQRRRVSVILGRPDGEPWVLRRPVPVDEVMALRAMVDDAGGARPRPEEPGRGA